MWGAAKWPVAGAIFMASMYLSGSVQAETRPSVAFFYGAHPPVEALSEFDQVVVEPDNVDAATLVRLKRHGAQVFAYVSVGEANRTRKWFSQIDRRWILGENAAWQSAVVDPSQDGWHRLLLAQMNDLQARGYSGFFLDTLDSYRSYARTDTDAAPKIVGLARFINAAHARFPREKLLLNRGFELLPYVHDAIVGVAAESLFAGWDQGHQKYVPVAEEARRWLLDRMTPVRDHYGKQAIFIDYVATNDRAKARDVAARIDARGFTPWVAPPDLATMGVGSVELQPRRILALYTGDLSTAGVHRFAAMPLEHLGYSLQYVDISHGLPPSPDVETSAGVVTWFTDDLPRELGYAKWLQDALARRVPIVALGALGTPDAAILKSIGMEPGDEPITPVRITHFDGCSGFESEVSGRSRGLLPWRSIERANESHLVVTDSKDNRFTPIVTGPWGGFASDPFVMEQGFSGRRRWRLNPFEFFAAALHRQPRAVPDVTTESGRRISLISVSAAGAGSRTDQPGQPPAANVLLDDLRRRGFPFAVLDDASSPASLRPALAHERLAELQPRSSPVLRPGHTALIEDAPSLTNVPPLGLDAEGGFVVYAPGESLEDGTAIGTALAEDSAPAIARLQVTDAPRRLKPVGLALRFEEAIEPAGMKTVDAVLDWLARQDAFPMWPSEYAQRAGQFREVTVLRTIDGGWRLRNLGPIRTLRLDAAAGWPDLSRSLGVAGVRDLPQGRYVTLAGEAEPVLYLRSAPPSEPYLESANGLVEHWATRGHVTTLRVRGHVPVELVVQAGARECHIESDGHRLTARRTGHRHTFQFPTPETGDVTLVCR